jgi:hypothetical protein
MEEFRFHVYTAQDVLTSLSDIARRLSDEEHQLHAIGRSVHLTPGNDRTVQARFDQVSGRIRQQSERVQILHNAYERIRDTYGSTEQSLASTYFDLDTSWHQGLPQDALTYAQEVGPEVLKLLDKFSSGLSVAKVSLDVLGTIKDVAGIVGTATAVLGPVGFYLSLGANAVENLVEMKTDGISLTRALEETAVETLVDMAVGTAIHAVVGGVVASVAATVVTGGVTAPAVVTAATGVTTFIVSPIIKDGMDQVTNLISGNDRGFTENISDQVLNALGSSSGQTGMGPTVSEATAATSIFANYVSGSATGSSGGGSGGGGGGGGW